MTSEEKLFFGADHEALDMGLLARDILEMFYVTGDRPANVLAVTGGQHRYAIQQR